MLLVETKLITRRGRVGKLVSGGPTSPPPIFGIVGTGVISPFTLQLLGWGDLKCPIYCRVQVRGYLYPNGFSVFKSRKLRHSADLYVNGTMVDQNVTQVMPKPCL